MKIKAFHIDMNNAQFTGTYLKIWLNRLAKLGYNTIIWEIEDNIKWKTCSQCSSSQAFSKQEFRKLLDYCKSVGLESIPLLQTLGHCEYVLKHDGYKHLAEFDDRVDQYCPLKNEVAEFINKWINEYLELFENVKFFHLGADEAWTLGECPACKKYVKQNSLSQLFFQHINKITEPLLKKGIRPIIWADMAIRHPESIDLLDKRVVLCDWMYEIGKDRRYVWNYNARKMQSPENFSDELKKRFEKYIFKDGPKDHTQPNMFYASDYLCDLGFDVIGCPSSSSFGDSVFIPQIQRHLQNCFDFIKKGLEDKMLGWALTSWTCHLFPWALQKSCIELPKWIENNSTADLTDYLGYYVKNTFGIEDDGTFWKATEAFSENGIAMSNSGLDIGKDIRKVDAKFIEKQIDKIQGNNQLDKYFQETAELIERFENGLLLFEKLAGKIKTGKDIILWWLAEAANQINRAKVIEYLLKKRKGLKPDNGSKLLSEILILKKQIRDLYAPIIKADRLNLMIHWIYDSTEYALKKQLFDQHAKSTPNIEVVQHPCEPHVFRHGLHYTQLGSDHRDITQGPEQAKTFLEGTCSFRFRDTPKKRTVILSFDDACKSHLANVAPILKKYGFGATFFICRFSDKWRAKNEIHLMTIEEIKQLADMGFEIGNHTWNHPDLRKCSDKECEVEIQRLNSFLADGDIELPVSFAYPGGPFAENAVPILKRLGIKFARTTEQKVLESRTNMLRIPAIPLQKDDELAFYDAVSRCNNSDAIALVFHGVPDSVHDFVSTSISFFENCMKYLHNNNYRVISFRDILKNDG